MAILVKFHTRRRRRRLYGEAAQRYMRLWKDCHIQLSAQVYVVVTLHKEKPRRSGVFFMLIARGLERQRFAVQFQFAVVVFQFGDVVFAFNGNEHRALAFDE